MRLNLLLFFSFGLIMEADGLCSLEHPQTVACRIHFIIRATVTSIAPETCEYNESNMVMAAALTASSASVPSSSSYGNVIATPKIITVRLDKLFKGYTYIKKAKGTILKIIFASAYSVPLRPGFMYLLTGFVANNKLRMDSCSWYQMWQQTTVTQYYGLRRYYWMYCACKIKYCPSGKCHRTYRTCLWEVPDILSAAKKSDCNSRHSICMVKNGRCTWYDPKRGRICPPSKSEMSNIP